MSNMRDYGMETTHETSLLLDFGAPPEVTP